MVEVYSPIFSTSSSSSTYSDTTDTPFNDEEPEPDPDLDDYVHLKDSKQKERSRLILPSSKSYSTFERPYSSVPFLNADIKYPDETAPLVYYQRKKSVVIGNDGLVDMEKGGLYEAAPTVEVHSLGDGGGVDGSVDADEGNKIKETGLPEPTIFSSTVNMINTILGTCMMSMPYAFARLGLIPGVSLVLLSAIITWFSLRILISSAQFPHHLGARTVTERLTFFTPSGAPSYAILSRTSMGASSAWWVDLLVAMSCFGFAVGYLVAIGECMPRLVTTVLPGMEMGEGFLALLLMNKRFWMFAALFLLVPLALSRDVDDFWWFSNTALACALYLAAVVIGLFVSGSVGGEGGLTTPPPAGNSSWQWFVYEGEIAEVVPVFLFAFTCQQNIFSVYNELVAATARAKASGKPQRPGGASVHDIYKIIDLAVATCAFTYISVGVAGYIAFGDGVDSILLNNYGNGFPVLVGRLAYAMLAALSYPIYVHPCRDAVDSFLSSCCATCGIGRPKFGYCVNLSGRYGRRSGVLCAPERLLVFRSWEKEEEGEVCGGGSCCPRIGLRFSISG
ncbi:hypothetical protein HDV00_005967 [Rhizophlyctis rosea]|nr:hypothetical protein HDV00_005967 [Rhizophlyctis rosea]